MNREALHHALTHCLGTVCLVVHSIILSFFNSRSSVSVVTKPWTGQPMKRCWFPAGTRNLSFLQTALNFETCSGAHPAMYSVGIGIKQSEREADHLPRFIAEIKHDQCHTFTPQNACTVCAATTLLLRFTLFPNILNLRSCTKEKMNLSKCMNKWPYRPCTSQTASL